MNTKVDKAIYINKIWNIIAKKQLNTLANKIINADKDQRIKQMELESWSKINSQKNLISICCKFIYWLVYHNL